MSKIPNTKSFLSNIHPKAKFSSNQVSQCSKKINPDYKFEEIRSIINDITKDNIKESIERITGKDSQLKVQQSSLFKTSHTRSEIYALCALFITHNTKSNPFGELNSKSLQIFINLHYDKNYKIIEGEDYINEFIMQSEITVKSIGGQEFITKDLGLLTIDKRKQVYNISPKTPELIKFECILQSLQSVGTISLKLDSIDLSTKDGESETRFDRLCQALENSGIEKLSFEDCIFGNSITEQNMQKLKNIKILEVQYFQMDSNGFEHFNKLQDLTKFTIVTNDIDNDGLKQIGKFNKLTSLVIKSSAITNEGLSELRELTKLNSLIIYAKRINDDGLKHIGIFNNLNRLIICSNQISENGLQHIIKLTNLNYLHVVTNKINTKTKEIIAKQPNIEHFYIS